MSTFLDHVSHVVNMRAIPEMIWSNAKRCIAIRAVMKNVNPRRNRSVYQRPGKPMSVLYSPLAFFAVLKAAVFPHHSADPKPATRPFQHKTPEFKLWWFSVELIPTGMRTETMASVTRRVPAYKATAAELTSIIKGHVGDLLSLSMLGRWLLAAVAPFLFYTTSAFGQCGTGGKLIFNPISGIFDCTGSSSSGTVTSIGLVGTANQITVTGATPITGSGSWTLSLPSAVTFPGSATVTGNFLVGTSSLNNPALSTPSAPVITNSGTPGVEAYGYTLLARNVVNTTSASAEGATATGNATLDATNYNIVTPPACATGQLSWDVYRTTDPNFNIGFIGPVACAGNLHDTGLPGIGPFTPLGRNTTTGAYLAGSLHVATGLFVGDPAIIQYRLDPVDQPILVGNGTYRDTFLELLTPTPGDGSSAGTFIDFNYFNNTAVSGNRSARAVEIGVDAHLDASSVVTLEDFYVLDWKNGNYLYINSPGSGNGTCAGVCGSFAAAGGMSFNIRNDPDKMGLALIRGANNVGSDISLGTWSSDRLTNYWSITHDGTASFLAATVNGNSINGALVGTTGSIGGGLLAAGACASGTVAVTGSTTAMTVTVSPNTYPGDGTDFAGYVSTNGTVTVKVCALVAVTPTSSTYNVRVIQ